MQEVIILAGPNGAGKTTFANEYLPAADEGLVFVNADEIAREVSVVDLPTAQADIQAARRMLEQIDGLAAARVEFMFETTLAGLTYARRIPIWRSLGYSVALIYLRLPSVERSIDRVRRRVEAGGHDIPETIIRRRYARSLVCFEQIYKPLVDEWYVWESLEGDFKVAETWDE